MSLIVIELLSIAALLTGIALIYVPAAFIVGGIIGVVACEMHARSTTRRTIQ